MSLFSPSPLPKSLGALDPAVLGLVLAGGRARRMGGGDKGLRLLGGRPIISRAIERFAPQLPRGAADLVLNANGDPARFAALGLDVLPDPIGEDQGPLAGVLAGLECASRRDQPWLVTIAADTPFPPLDLVERLRAAQREHGVDVVFAATRDPDADPASAPRPHPTFGLWRASLAAELRDFLNETDQRKVLAFADRLDSWRCEVPSPDPRTGLDPFFNVNTPEDLALAETALAEGRPQ